MLKLAVWGFVIIGAMVMLGATMGQLTTAGVGFVTEASGVVLTLVPKLAVGSAALSFFLGIIPWTRKHALGVLKWSVLAFFGSSLLTASAAFLNVTANGLAPVAASLASEVVTKALGGFTAGISGIG